MRIGFNGGEKRRDEEREKEKGGRGGGVRRGRMRRERDGKTRGGVCWDEERGRWDGLDWVRAVE